ncbi:MAG TPA: excinuclease ABC subunit UvrC [Xanthobacteraceae bacterium]|nr:excinuclease ABC subunit UvrC [Xanthobacteraceae bacterium]
MDKKRPDIDPETALTDSDESPEIETPIELAQDTAQEEEPAAEAVATGVTAIQHFAKLAPSTPGVYRMLSARGEVLYVGKAKNIAKRVAAYTRGTGHANRIARMIAATTAMEFVSTATETEALLLEANLIKRFAPRFNVLLRDDKSFPYILITRDQAAPQIVKHRGARNRAGDYYGPFAAAGAVNRTLTALERAFLLRSCSDAFYQSRTRPCLLYQIKRCSAPCTGEISLPDYNELVEEAREFLSGKSSAVKDMLAAEMEKSSAALDFERAAALRDRLEALSTIQSHQGVHPRSTDAADIFACHQEGGITCIEVFFIRNFQNWGDRAYYPRADRSLDASEVLDSFLPQFYESRTAPRSVLLSHDIEDRELLAEALSTRADHKVEVTVPQRGEKRELVEHALLNARAALGRRLAESSSQNRLLKALAETFHLPRPPRRIEVYDNSHIQGANAVGVMIVAGPEGFAKNQYRKFNIKSEDIARGDDTGMMREVLRRRFARLKQESPRAPDADVGAESPWPDLVILDGGQGQLTAALETLAAAGVDEVPVIAVAKGLDRDVGRETFHQRSREPFRLPPRDPVLYFVERLRDEAHRFAVGSHRTRRKKDIASAGLQEIPGVGPSRKRALLRHFGTLSAVERAAVSDLEKVPGINAATARAIYDFFHANG